MVLKPNLGGDPFPSTLWFTWPRRTPPRCTHSGDFTRDREFDSDVSHFLILIKAYLIFVYTHFTWFFFILFTSVGDEWESGGSILEKIF